jgi:putative transposase
VAVSVACGTICCVPETAAKDDTAPLVSHTGVPLTRATTFRFTLDVNREQHQLLLAHAGAARLAYNHQLARVKANLNQRAAERTYGVADADLTPALSWSKVSFINHMNAWKDGRAPDSRVSCDAAGGEVRGLPWRGEVSADVFECASVNAAQALKNWSESRGGARAGKAAGFPRFKSRHKTTPVFRLRAKYTEGAAPPVRATGPHAMRFPKLGELRVREDTRRLRKLYETGRFHAYAASFRFERGRWVVSVTGVAAQLHPARRDTRKRHQPRVGVDLGVKTLAVVADETGAVLAAVEGVKALQHAQARLKLANQSYSRTKRDSAGRRKAARRLGRVHARVAQLRRNLLHELSAAIVKGHAAVVIEDLHAAGMLANRKLARVVSDASFGELRRQVTYKAAWYGTDLTVANRWYPSSKTCSGCGHVNADLTLSDRTCDCKSCGLVLDRDVNAAINPGPLHRTAHCFAAATRGRLTPARVRTRMDRDVEPTATPHHEGALGRNRDKTRHQGVAGARTATKNHHPARGESQGKPVSPNKDTPSDRNFSEHDNPPVLASRLSSEYRAPRRTLAQERDRVRGLRGREAPAPAAYRLHALR